MQIVSWTYRSYETEHTPKMSPKGFKLLSSDVMQTIPWLIMCVAQLHATAPFSQNDPLVKVVCHLHGSFNCHETYWHQLQLGPPNVNLS